MEDDSETMTECSAAMLLMKLSCSPASAGNFMPSTSAPNFTNPDRPPSVDSSSGASSFRSGTPSPPLSSSATTDEGIVKDFPMEQNAVRKYKQVYSFLVIHRTIKNGNIYTIFWRYRLPYQNKFSIRI